MSHEDWCYADHVLGFGVSFHQDPVVPVVCEDGRILAQVDGIVWCDVRDVTKDDTAVLLVDTVNWEICGTHLRPGTWRAAWADDVALLDIDEAIWVITAASTPKPRRAIPHDNSQYWVGVGACGACSNGLVGVFVSENDSLLYVCDGCGRCWIDRTKMSNESALPLRVEHQMEFASAGQVAADRWSRFQQLLAEEPRDNGAIDNLFAQRWTIRPQSSWSWPLPSKI